MRNPGFDSMVEVIRFCWKNQQSEVDGVEKNYFKNIAENTGLNERTVTRAVWGLEYIGYAKVFHKGTKKCVRICNDISEAPMWKD